MQCSIAGVLYGTGYTEAYVAAAKREGRTLDDVEGAPASDENDVRWPAISSAHAHSH